MIKFLRRILENPLSRGLDLNAPETTELRVKIIEGKKFLKKIYVEWYQVLLANLPEDILGKVLELGSGAGFLKKISAEIITSDIIFLPHLDTVLDAHWLPLSSGSLKSIVMVNVFHHLPDVEKFLHEASRCVTKGGNIVLVEPWVTKWSWFVFSRLHHEPFFPEREDWQFLSEGPLSGANHALPWIIFERDRQLFEEKFPEWNISEIKMMMPFRYMVSGGVSMRSLMPGWSYPLWRGLEWCLKPLMSKLAMFALIVLERK